MEIQKCQNQDCPNHDQEYFYGCKNWPVRGKVCADFLPGKITFTTVEIVVLKKLIRRQKDVIARLRHENESLKDELKAAQDAIKYYIDRRESDGLIDLGATGELI